MTGRAKLAAAAVAVGLALLATRRRAAAAPAPAPAPEEPADDYSTPEGGQGVVIGGFYGGAVGGERHGYVGTHDLDTGEWTGEDAPAAYVENLL